MINHDLQYRAGTAEVTKLFDHPLGMRGVMDDTERIDQVVGAAGTNEVSSSAFPWWKRIFEKP